jgi:hypothetical protein
MKKRTDFLNPLSSHIIIFRPIGIGFALCVCFLFLASAVISQPVFSEQPAEEPGFGYIKVIGQDKGGYFILLSNLSHNMEGDRVGFKNRKYKLAYYDTQLKKKWVKPIDPPGDNSQIEGVVFFNSRVMVVNASFFSRESRLSYSIYFIGADGNQGHEKTNIVSFAPVTADYSKTKIVLSLKRNLAALVVRELANDYTQSWYCAVIDTSLQLVSTRSAYIEIHARNSGMTAFALSDSGHFAMLFYNSEKIKAMSSKRKTDYFLYCTSTQDTVFREYQVLPGKSITGIGLAMDNVNGRLVVAGFFTGEENFASGGTLYGTLDLAKGGELNIIARRIEEQDRMRLKGERILDGGYGVSGYPIERMVLRSDGGAVIIAEAAYTTDFSFYDSFTQSFTRRTEFHFENIVVISLGPDGTAEWNAIVEKDQVSYDDDGVFSSFASLLLSDRLVMIYNEDISRRGKVFSASINRQGQLERPAPMTQTDGLLLLPRSGKQIAENELLVPAYRKKDLYLAKFAFE